MLAPADRAKLVKRWIRGAKGTFFTARTIKKNGEVRTFNAKGKHLASLKGGELSYDATSKGHVPIWDRKVKDWRMLNTGTLEYLRIKGKTLVE